MTIRLHPRLLLAAALVALVMVPVGVFLAAVGVLVLEVSGGAARDTGTVVAVAALLVTDFWGGGAVAGLTRVQAREAAVAWGIARAVVLLLAGLVVSTQLLVALPVLVLLAVPAAWAGARVARKQLAMRRAIRRDRARAEQLAARAATSSPAATVAAEAGSPAGVAGP